MPPRRSARAKATVPVAGDTVEVNTSPKVQEPQTPQKGTKRVHSDDESEMPPAKKIKIPTDGRPRRPDGTAMKVPIDHMSGFYDGAGSRLPSFFQSEFSSVGHQVYVDGKGEVYDGWSMPPFYLLGFSGHSQSSCSIAKSNKRRRQQ